MCWKLNNVGSLLQDSCKEGNSGFQLLSFEELKACLAQSMELECML